jgi:hypothetical protein
MGLIAREVGEQILYEFEDIAFVNTSELTETAKHFSKHGVYTYAPVGTREHKDFWDREEYKINNGVTLPGKLIKGTDGKFEIQKVHITGKHYAYLNYGRIKLTKSFMEEDSEKVVKNVTHTMVARKKVAFPDFWDGDYNYFHAINKCEEIGRNLIVFKARRKGYSYKGGFLAAIEANMYPDTTVVLGANDMRYLTQGDGLTRMAKNYLDFLESETDFNRGYLSPAIENLRLGYRLQGEVIDRGYKSSIISVSFKDNPDAAIGKDASKIFIEEAGKFPNMQAMYDVTQPTLEDGDIIVGMMIVFGTGGTKDANWATLEKMFYNPELYNALTFNNVWDTDKKGKSCGYFHSHVQNLKPYVDKDGNSDKETSLKVSAEAREKKKKTTTNAQDFNMYIGQRCITPQEGFSRTSSNIFSSVDLDDHVSYVAQSQELRDLARHGILEYTKTKSVKFTSNLELPRERVHSPILDFPHSVNSDVTGCLVEYQPPVIINGVVPSGLYRVWHDPYAQDKDKDEIKQKDSLGATFVYERVNTISPTQGDILVASYVGRPATFDEYNEMLLKIALRYNAEVAFENDRGDVKGYFRRAGYYHLLADEPDFNWKQEIQGKHGRNKGTSMNNIERKGTAAMLLKDWLYSPRGTDENGKRKLTLHYIFDLPLLIELQKWELKGNFDRVSALLIGMFDKNEVFNKEIEAAVPNNPNDFFNRNLY